MNADEGKKIIQTIVDEWSQIYVNKVTFIQSFNNVHNYSVTFSRPAKSKAVAEGTVKVYFYIVEKTEEDITAEDDGLPYKIEFNFESESLRHTMDKTMRKNMFEKWMDRVLDKKNKIKELLHLGTEFEYTRVTDEKSKIVDPFVPKFDITRVKDFSKEIKQSQKVRVESPRFIRTLRNALNQVFYEADKDHSGYLDYEEFKNSFKNLSYGLNDNDIYTLIALADENADGKINWEEFIPIGIEVIKTFYARNKTIQKSEEKQIELNKEAMEKLYIDEIKKAWEVLEKKFKKQDIKNDGKVTIFQLKKVLKGTNFVTPKEINALVRDVKGEYYAYENFVQDLFNVRFELAKSRILESNVDQVQQSIIQDCQEVDTEKNGKIDVAHLREILLNSKFIALTPFQIHILLGQAVQDEDGMVNYKQFSTKAKEMIENVYSVEALSTAADLIKNSVVKEEDIEQTYISNLDLFKIFKKYDKNMNGYLDFNEYMACLNDHSLNLTKQEIVSLTLIADTNSDGEIDYEEFMKHFTEFLFLVRFQERVNQTSSVIMEK